MHVASDTSQMKQILACCEHRRIILQWYQINSERLTQNDQHENHQNGLEMGTLVPGIWGLIWGHRTLGIS